MTIHISEQSESRLAAEAHRQGLSVDALIERLINNPGSGTPAEPGPRSNATVFEQGLGMFGSSEDAALIDDVVALAYADRRRPSRDQLLAL